MSRDPERVAFGIVIAAILFLAALFNWGGAWKSRTRRRLGLLTFSSGVLCGTAFLVRDLELLPFHPFDELLTFAGVLLIFLGLGLAVATLLVPNRPDQP